MVPLCDCGAKTVQNLHQRCGFPAPRPLETISDANFATVRFWEPVGTTWCRSPDRSPHAAQCPLFAHGGHRLSGGGMVLCDPKFAARRPSNFCYDAHGTMSELSQPGPSVGVEAACAFYGSM